MHIPILSASPPSCHAEYRVISASYWTADSPRSKPLDLADVSERPHNGRARKAPPPASAARILRSVPAIEMG